MTTQQIPAHYDGHHVCLDMDVDLEPNAKLVVMVVDPTVQQEREEWNKLSLQAFARLTADEPDEYTSDMIKVRNPYFRDAR